MRRKTTVWIYQAANIWDYLWEKLNMAEIAKTKMKNWNTTSKETIILKWKLIQHNRIANIGYVGKKDETVYHIETKCKKKKKN